MTVYFLDLDGFKKVNERLGHDAGDHVLRTVAETLRAGVRPSDTVARLGSDEFVVVCESVDAAAVAFLGERLRWSVSRAGASPVTASVGVVRSLPTESAEALLARADEAMGVAKRGR